MAKTKQTHRTKPQKTNYKKANKKHKQKNNT